MFCLKLLLILNLLNAVLSKATFENMFVSSDGVLCIKEIHRLGPMDLKIYTLAKKTVTVTRQLTNLWIVAKIISATSISGHKKTEIWAPTRLESQIHSL
jgi:hypothetical protein